MTLILVLVVLMAVARLVLLAITVYARHNFHAVIPGVLYRSAQLAPKTLAHVHQQHAFRSVINLRGAAPGAAWYDVEVATCTQLGIAHANLRLLSRRIVTPAEVQILLALMHDLPKPILIHCKRGADRTGFAAALYLACIMHAPLARASAQLSLRYGHIGVPYLSEAYPMDVSWRREKAALRHVRQRHAASASTTLHV